MIHWLIDEDLFNKFPKLKQDMIMTMVSMRAVHDLRADTWFNFIAGKDKLALSYAKGLEKSAVHAYHKRLCNLEEYRKPESLLAILQYEFQARMMLTKTKPPESVKRYIEFVCWTIGNFAKRNNIELFEDTGLLMGFQHRCETCEKCFFSEKVLDKCLECGNEGISLEEICTYPHGYKIKEGSLLQTGNMGGFCPSNGSEDKSIASIKKIFGVI